MVSFPDRKIFDHSSQGTPPESLDGKDYLTEVYLRATLKPYLNDLIQQAETDHKVFSIVFLDLDRFKKFNDKYGHLFGDEILKYIGSLMRLSFQGVPCRVFRYGGDEFIIVFPDKTPRESQRMVQSLKHNMIRRPVLYKGRFFKITASYGIAGYPTDATMVDDLVKKADMAQYMSKSQGHNLVTLANEINSRRFYKAAMLFSIGIVYIILALLSRPFLSRLIETTIGWITPGIEQRNKNLDRIVLRNGTVLHGEIVQETYRGLTLNYPLKDRIVSMYFDKSQIQEKTYGLKTDSRKKFDDYIRAHPNPHVW